MSIFKESFRKCVQQQLKLREHIVAMGNKDKGRFVSSVLDLTKQGGQKVNIDPGAFFTNTVNRACVIRMSSGVDLLPTSKNIIEGGKYERRDDMVGAGMAQRWILEGGTLLGIKHKDKWLTSTRRGFPGTAGKLKSGKQRKWGFQYGDPVIRADAGDGYGIVPMPGIKQIEVKTKSAYGSLREGKVTFHCHNQRQLEILELLYMRPGYPILLEWGWTTYMGNDGKRTSEFPHIKDFFSGDVTQEYVTREIIKNKSKTGGNYDGLMGICKNFQYTARPDGGYDCTTEMTAVGEVIESVRSKRVSVKDPDYRKHKTKGGEWKEVDEIEVFLEKVLAYNELKDHTKKRWYGSKAFWKDIDFGKKAKKETALLAKSLSEMLPTVEGQPDGSVYPWVLDQHTEMKGENGEKIDNKINACFVRWDALAHLFNTEFIPKDGKTGAPLFVIQSNLILKEDEKIDRNTPYEGKHISPLLYNIYEDPVKKAMGNEGGSDYMDMSLDPSIGMLPHQLDELKIKDHNLGRLILGVCALGFVPTAGIGAKIIQEEFKAMCERPISKDVENRMIGKIYFNVQRILDTYKNMRYDSDGIALKSFNLYDYIEKIWNMMDDACAGTHNFELDSDFERPHIVRVIDRAFNAGSGEDLDYDDIVELNIQSNTSIVRDFSYHTSIPSAMTATIATAAQAPNNMENLEKTSFAALHRAIKNRFTVPDEPPPKLTKEQKEKQTKALKEKQEQWKKEHEARVKFYKEGKETLKWYQEEILKGEYQEVNKKGVNADEAKVSEAKGILRKTIESAQYLVSHYQKTKDGVSQGQPIPKPKNPRSAIIPLKFNATLDGISGVIIGNVFKIQKSRLPRGYKEADVGFVVTGESQSVGSNQDWTTRITGQMVLLWNKNKGKGTGEGDNDGEGTGVSTNDTMQTGESENNTTDTDKSQQNQLDQQDKCAEGQHWDEELQTCVMDEAKVVETKNEPDFTGYDEWKQSLLKYSENFGHLRYYQNEFVVNENEGRYQSVKKGSIGTIEIVNTGDLLFTNSMGYVKNQKVLAINISKQYKGAHFMDKLKEEFGEKGAIGSGVSNVVLKFDEVKKYHDEAIAKKQNASHVKQYYDNIMREAKRNPYIIQGINAERKKAPAGGWPKGSVPTGQDPNADIIKRDEVDYDISIDPSLIKDFEPYSDI